MASSQLEEGGLLELLQLVDWVNTTADAQPALSPGALSVVIDGFWPLCCPGSWCLKPSQPRRIPSGLKLSLQVTG